MKNGRQEAILNLLKNRDIVGLEEFRKETGASYATIRRDLKELEQKGALRRCRGGAVAEKQVLTGYKSQPDPFLTEKETIAGLAVRLICSGDHIFVGAGMTGNLLCRYLAGSEIENVTVVTSNVTAVMELAADPRFSVLLLGGKIHAGVNHVETLDEFTVENLSQFYFNKAFFTVDGAELNYGYSIKNRSEMILYKYVLEHSEGVYLMLGSSKTEVKTFTRFAKLEEIPHVISDSGLPENYSAYYRKNHVDLILEESKKKENGKIR